MPVFNKYNPQAAGGVFKQAHPSAEPYQWVPLVTTTRDDSQWGGAGRVHRVGPHERGTFFSRKPLGGGGAAAGCDCGGGCVAGAGSVTIGRRGR